MYFLILQQICHTGSGDVLLLLLGFHCLRKNRLKKVGVFAWDNVAGPHNWTQIFFFSYSRIKSYEVGLLSFVEDQFWMEHQSKNIWKRKILWHSDS